MPEGEEKYRPDNLAKKAWGGVKGFFSGTNRAAEAEKGPYGGINEDNFALQGADAREQQYQQLIQGLQGQYAPQASADAYTSQRQQALIDMLGAQARGEGPSMANLAAEQASQRGVSQQQAMLASGRGNQAGAARAAAQQAGALQGSIAGNAAQARVQEQLGAQNALGNALNAYRGQNQQLALANQQAEMGNRQLQQSGIQNLLAQSLQQAGMQQQGGMGLEAQRTQRYMGAMGAPTQNEQLMQGIIGGASMLFSDERLKENIEDGDEAANTLMRGLQAYSYDYKNKDHGSERQLGVMAQDLEKVLPQAVIDTPTGKAVHGAKLAGALAAALPTLEKRLSKLEKK